jgi:hypothetical protein
VVARHGVRLAAFLARQHPYAAALRVLSSAARTGVLPSFTVCEGLRTQMVQSGQALFDGRGRTLLLLYFDPGGDVKRLHGPDLWRLVSLAPGQKPRHRAAIGRRVLGFLIRAAKNSRKRSAA